MASSINPNNVSVTYPIAGQDNDSQGFRDNFNNIKTNLTSAKTELEDLQAKALLKSALTGTTLANDGSGSILEDHELKDMALSIVSKGTLSGAVAIDFSAGHFQTVQSGATLEPAFSNWPATTKYGAVTVEFDITNTAYKVTLPTQCTLGVSELSDYNSTTRQISFADTGKYRFKFSTIDAGSTVAIEDLNRSPNRVHGERFQIELSASSPSGTGAAGDKAGMIAVDADAIYLAYNNYDGSATVWKKVDVHANEATSNRLLRTGGNAISGTILPDTTNTRPLGSTAKKFSNVHSTMFTGALTGSVQALSGPGACNTTTLVTQVTTTGADALTLPNGTNGQIKIITMVADGGVGTLTPTTFANGTTLAFDDVGDSAMFVYNTTGGWALISNTGCTLA